MKNKYSHRSKLNSPGSQLLLTSLGAIALLIASPQTSFAADGTWNNTSGGTWGTAGNWSGNVIADGAANTANFNTLDLSAQTTVTLDSARTLGTLIFGDTDTNSAAGWILDNGGTAANTINVTNITVNSIFAPNTDAATNDVILGAVVAGSGFVKNGAGTLTLTNANTMGSLRIDEGLIAVGNTTALGSGNKKVTYNGGGIRIATTAAIGNTNEVLTSGTIYSGTVNYDAFNGPWIGSGTLSVVGGARFTVGGNVATTFTNFFGTIDLTNGGNGLLFRVNIGAGSVYDFSKITINTGTNAARFAPRLQVPGTFKIGALTGSGNSQMLSSENSGGTLTTWEVGGLNLSTTFGGRFSHYNGDASRIGALNKVGTGKLTLTHANSDYRGTTTVTTGSLALSGGAMLVNTPSISVLSGAVFDVSGLTTPWSLRASQTLGGVGSVVGNVALTNGTINPGTAAVGTLTFSNNLVCDGLSTTTNAFDVTSPGTGDQIRVLGDLTFNNTVVVRVLPTGASIPDGTYTLMKWDGTLTGDLTNLELQPPVQPGTFTLQLDLGAKELRLNVSGVAPAANLVWKGDGAANDWDITTANWLNGATPSTFINGDKVTFNDVGSNNVPVNLAMNVNPSALLVNATKDYTLSSSAAFGIIGSSTLVKSNTGVFTTTADNAFTGGTLIAGGAVQIGDGVGSSGSLGAGNVTNNAKLIYNRPDNLTNINLIVGTGAVVKSAANTLTIAGNNTYAGGTTISNGTLRIASYGTLGSGPVTFAGGNFEIVPTGSSTVGVSNAVVIEQNGTLQYNGNQSFACVIFGPLTGTPGATLTLNSINAAALNRLRLYGNFTNSVNLDLSVSKVQLAPYNAAGSQAYNGIISGPGQITQRGNGGIFLNNTNLFSGGAILSQGSFAVGADSVMDGGVLVSGPLGVGPLVLGQETGLNGSGTILASGGPRVIGNNITYDNATNNFTWVLGGANNLTFTGPMTLHGEIDSAGGVNRPIQVDAAVQATVAGPISDNGLNCGVTKTGNGLLLLNGTNTYTGTTTVNAGHLGGTGIIGGPVVVAASGALAPGASIGTLRIENDLTINGGGLAIEVNKSVAPSNDVVTVTGGLTNNGNGTIVVTNYGPALVAGDKFFLFNKPVVNGATLNVMGGGVNWTNKLAVNGSIEVLAAAPTIPTTPTNITFSASGGNLTLTWPASHTGWSLQAQTNTRSVGLNTNWFTLPGYETSNTATVPISPANPTVFYRLFYQVP